MTVPCPRCGGTRQRLLSPGYVQCTSEFLDGVAPLPGRGEQAVYAVCGHRFRVGSPAAGAPSCVCGMFAIGHCAVCGEPRCGEHAVMSGGRLQCPVHLRERAAQERAEAGPQLAAAAAALRDWLAAISDPEQRLLAACLHFGYERDKTAAYDVGPMRIEWVAPEVLGNAFPEFDRQTVRAFFTPFFGTDEDTPAPTRAGATPATLRACRERARRANVTPPPPRILADWRAAARRVSAMARGSASSAPSLIAEMLDEFPPPPSGTAVSTPTQAVAPSPPPQLTVDQRIEAALRTLKTRGVRPTRRAVPGRYHLSPVAKMFGRVGEHIDVEVEPAYPVGSCTWSQPGPRGTDRYETLPTGVTPSRRVVPMTRATAGDNVETLYARWTRRVDTSSGQSTGRTLYPTDIAQALEQLVEQASGTAPGPPSPRRRNPAATVAHQRDPALPRRCVRASCADYHTPTAERHCPGCGELTQAS